MNIERRFRELAVKEALGTITPGELDKLNRYQALRRPELSETERRLTTERDWKIRVAFKAVKSALRPTRT